MGLPPAYSLVASPPSTLQAPPHLKIGSRKTQDRKFWCDDAPSWGLLFLRSWGWGKVSCMAGLELVTPLRPSASQVL